ncbi:MAG: twin-arginine translocation signal domain-containing protein, partial [Planctomycetota bacterium]
MLMNDRRTFLKTAAMAAATAVAETSLGKVPRSIALPLLGSFNDLAWHKAPCRFCGTGCHVQVGVDNGRVVAVAGDQNADVNRGLLCVKGYHVGSILYGKDRLT